MVGGAPPINVGRLEAVQERGEWDRHRAADELEGKTHLDEINEGVATGLLHHEVGLIAGRIGVYLHRAELLCGLRTGFSRPESGR